jgi:hypothetical protein
LDDRRLWVWREQTAQRFEPSSGDLSYKIANQQLGTFADEFAKANRALLRTYI